jgi:hypothetical protein
MNTPDQPQPIRKPIGYIRKFKNTVKYALESPDFFGCLFVFGIIGAIVLVKLSIILFIGWAVYRFVIAYT